MYIQLQYDHDYDGHHYIWNRANKLIIQLTFSVMSAGIPLVTIYRHDFENDTSLQSNIKLSDLIKRCSHCISLIRQGAFYNYTRRFSFSN